MGKYIKFYAGLSVVAISDVQVDKDGVYTIFSGEKCIVQKVITDELISVQKNGGIAFLVSTKLFKPLKEYRIEKLKEILG